jgi:hypothetical protein
MVIIAPATTPARRYTPASAPPVRPSPKTEHRSVPCPATSSRRLVVTVDLLLWVWNDPV